MRRQASLTPYAQEPVSESNDLKQIVLLGGVTVSLVALELLRR